MVKVANDLQNHIGETSVQNRFLSFSTNPNKTAFGIRPVIIHTVMKKGSNAYITKNIREAEIIYGRGCVWKLEKAHVSDNRLHLFVELIN